MNKMRPALLFLALWVPFATANPIDDDEPMPARQILAPAERSDDTMELLPSFSILTPGRLTLKSHEYVAPLSEVLTGIVGIGLGPSWRIAHFGDFDLHAQAQLGYRIKQGIFPIDSPDGRTDQDVTLHWVPLSGSAKLAYFIPGVDFAKPTLTLGGGIQWLYLSGSLSGLSSSYWVPYFLLAPAVTILESADGDWFNGFTFGATYYQGLSRVQEVSGLSIDLGLNIRL